MKRQTVYAGQVPLETDLLNTNKNVLTAIGHVLQDMLGVSTLFSGLGCVATAPAGMTVNVNPGRAYSLQAIDTGAWSSLSADAHQIMKQGILLDAQNFACPAPTTAGFSINYLIQGAFQEVDTGSTVLPYYNASNPGQAYNGPNGTGTSQTTARDNTVQLQLKAGVAATTGSQITPTPDAGFTGLWVVTVPFGAATITSSNISQYAGAPFLPASLLQMIQQGSSNYAVATGTANAHVAAFSPPITARVDGMVLRYKAPAANTGALTFNDGLGAAAVVGAAHAALQGGETTANGDVWVQWNSSIGGGSYIMLDSSGGALQVAPATQSQHAVQFGQLGNAGVVPGRLLRVTTYINNAGTLQSSVDGSAYANASSTFTALSSTSTIEAEVLGGGGGGGGATATGASQVSAGSGGGAGGYARKRSAVATFNGQTITCGAAGTATAGGIGGAGGTSSIGAVMSATGGQGGALGPATAVSNSPAGGATGGSGTGGDLNEQGGAGLYGFYSSSPIGGNGGGSVLGGGGQGGSGTSGGTASGSNGAGGGGGSLSPSSAAASGGAGKSGTVIIREFS